VRLRGSHDVRDAGTNALVSLGTSVVGGGAVTTLELSTTL
jgi:hypothetical protein